MLGSGWGMICISQSSGIVMGGGDQGPEDSHGMKTVVKRPRVRGPVVGSWNILSW